MPDTSRLVTSHSRTYALKSVQNVKKPASQSGSQAGRPLSSKQGLSAALETVHCLVYKTMQQQEAGAISYKHSYKRTKIHTYLSTYALVCVQASSELTRTVLPLGRRPIRRSSPSFNHHILHLMPFAIRQQCCLKFSGNKRINGALPA